MNKKLIWVIVIVVIIIIVGGIYFYQAEKETNYGDSEAQLKLIGATWETYTNEKFGYSFKYPQNWVFEADPPDSSGVVGGYGFYKANDIRMMSVHNPIREIGYEFLESIKTEKVKIGNTNQFFTKTTFTDKEVPNGVTVHVTWNEDNWNKSGEIWFNFDKRDPDENKLDEILSTFKFTN